MICGNTCRMSILIPIKEENFILHMKFLNWSKGQRHQDSLFILALWSVKNMITANSISSSALTAINIERMKVELIESLKFS
jgi:hypothetical protein